MKKTCALFLSLCLIITLFPSGTLYAAGETITPGSTPGTFQIHRDTSDDSSETEVSSVPEESPSETESKEESGQEENSSSSESSAPSQDESTNPSENESSEDPDSSVQDEDSSVQDSSESGDGSSENGEDSSENSDGSSEDSEDSSEPQEEEDPEIDPSTQEFLDWLNQEIDALGQKPYAIANGDVEFEMNLQKFPASYHDALRKLHASHPNWTFQAVNTNLDWYEVIRQESSYNRALIPVTADDLFKSKASGDYNPSTGKYVAKDGSTWVSASRGAVAYFMDPRNFLDEKYIFMFEANSYNDKQTFAEVESILDGTFMSTKNSPTIKYLNKSGKTVEIKNTYAQVIWGAGKESGVSPLYIASKIRQEVGANGSGSTSGKYGSYPGIYNFYNIGAYSGADPISNGLSWASSGTSYYRPWTDPTLSIRGGAVYIGEQYIKKGQDTNYFVKFNVGPNRFYTTYSHQYMTNIAGAAGEAQTTYAAYQKMGSLGTARVFYIPVYNNMPEKGEAVAFSGGVSTGSATETVNVRSASSISSEVLTTLAKGTKVTILDKTSESYPYTYSTLANPYWYKVSFTQSGKTVEGYVHESYIQVDSSVSVNPNGTKKLTLSAGDASKVYFETQDPAIATISADGTVTGVKGGTTTVYAISGGGKFDAMRVTVSGAAAPKPAETLVRYQITEDNVRYRTGPGLSAGIVGKLMKGASVDVVDGYATKANGYTWYKIKLNGKYYYMASSYMKKVATPVNVTINFDANTGTVSPTSKSYVKDSAFGALPTPTKEDCAFQGWFTAATGGSKVTSSTTVTGAMTLYAQWKRSITAAAVSVSAVNSQAFTGSAIRPAVTVIDDGTTLQENKDYTLSYSGNINPGTATITITGTGTYGGSRKVNFTITESLAQYQLTEDNVRYRTSAGLSGGIAGKLMKGAKVDVVEGYSTKANGYTWFKIKKSGKYYYIASEYLKRISGSSSSGSSGSSGSSSSGSSSGSSGGSSSGSGLSTYTTTDNLNYRTGPGTGYARKGTLKQGTSVQVVDGYTTKANGYTWYKIQLNGGTYYVASNYLKKAASSSGSSSSGSSSGESLSSYKTTDRLNYRTGPGTGYGRVGTLNDGATVQVVNGYATKANGYTWYKIKLNGSYYYVASAYLKK